MIAVDTHVHIHPCFDSASVFSAAVDNLNSAAKGEGCVERVLCLTESEGASVFKSLHANALAGEAIDGWSLLESGEDSLIARHPEKGDIRIFAGRQIVTTDRLEVLSLGRDLDIPDYSGSTEEIIQRVNKSGAMAVVPWGFGKWTGERGTIVSALLENSSLHPFWLGDNSGRLKGSREPNLFEKARGLGMGVLPGSDPLPFRGQQRIPGRYAALLDGSLSADAPFEALKQIFRGCGADIRSAGVTENIFSFLCNQLRMQIRKRLNQR